MTKAPATPPPDSEQNIEEIGVSEEMRGSFLEYAYSVIYTRALPDARDGLKPVQRRILYQMDQLGLRPDHGHVKSSRVVGDVMGKLHPHGDTAIYDALVRLAQPFNQRVPLVDGHGNFGSLDDGPAAARYTEARLDPAAMQMVSGLDEDTVDFVPNYDNQFMQPEVLPAAFPNLLINGASGIAVGMATNIAPHNPSEALAGALHLLENPDATSADLQRFIPGPDFPSGGVITDRTGVQEAYETGRGSFKVRAKVSVERVSARKMGLVVTELPYMVGPERVIDKVKDAVSSGKLKGISAITNLTDRHHGLRMVIDLKNGFNPQAVLAALYKLTPLEESFSMNAVALVDGQPRQLPLREMLRVFVDHRREVTRRRTQYRLDKARKRLHLVEGLLRAIIDIDEVIAIIRSSDDAAVAEERLRLAFELSELQAQYILELRLRRLTKFSRLELEKELSDLQAAIAELESILGSEEVFVQTIAADLRAAAAVIGDGRRTALLDGAGGQPGDLPPEAPLEVADEPCLVVLAATGELSRIPGAEPLTSETQTHGSVIRAAVPATARGRVGVVTEDGMLHRLEVVSLPQLVRSPAGVDLRAGVPALELIDSQAAAVGLVDLGEPAVTAVGTARGIVKRIRPDFPGQKDAWPIISLEQGDKLVGCGPAPDDADLVFVTAGAQLLRIEAGKVRPQGPAAGGVAGIRLGVGDQAIYFAPIRATEEACVVTVATQTGMLAGTAYTSLKITPLAAFPYKGRATLGVRCQRLLQGEDALALAWCGPRYPLAETALGAPVRLPELDLRRDGSGTPAPAGLAYLG